MPKTSFVSFVDDTGLEFFGIAVCINGHCRITENLLGDLHPLIRDAMKNGEFSIWEVTTDGLPMPFVPLAKNALMVDLTEVIEYLAMQDFDDVGPKFLVVLDNLRAVLNQFGDLDPRFAPFRDAFLKFWSFDYKPETLQ